MARWLGQCPWRPSRLLSTSVGEGDRLVWRYLTSCKDVVMDLDPFRPAGARHVWLPHFLDGRTLGPRDGDGDTEASVDGDDDEPDHGLEPPRRDPEHGDGKRGLAPQGCEDGEGTGKVGKEEEDFEVFHVELAERPSETDIDAGRDEGAIGNEGELRGGGHPSPRLANGRLRLLGSG